MDYNAFFTTIVFVVLAYQLVTVVYCISVWRSVRSNTLLFLLAFALGEFLVGAIGVILAVLSIHNYLFHQYASLLHESMLVLFALSLLREKTNRILLKIIFFSIVIALLVVIALPLNTAWQTLFNYPYLIEISVGLIILKDRVNNHEGRTFKEDPWSVISANLVIAGCIVFFSQLSMTVNTFHDIHAQTLILKIVEITNVVTMMIKYILLTTQLWKLKRYSM